MVTLISFTIVIGILVFVHEFGHFIVAKKTGVGVEKFSLGFGPKLIGFKKGETQYMISAIHLGGYVKLKGENPDETLTDDPKEFGSRSVAVRAAIISAGPVMNFILTFFLMPLVFIIGIQVPAFLEEEPVVCWVAENSPAEIAGFQIGDTIFSVNGEKVKNWKMFNALTQTQLGKDVKIETERNNKIQEKIVTAISDSFSIEGIGVFHKMDPQIGGLISNSPASEAGLQPGDYMKGINGTDITHWVQMSEIIRKFPGEEIRFKIERDGKDLLVNVKPDALIDEVEENSPAELAGLKAGDKILTINSKDVSLWKKPLLDKIFANEDELIFGISRDSKKLAVTVTPQEIQDTGIRVSGKVGIIPFEETIFKRYGIFASIIEGFKQAFEMTGLTLWALGKMFTLQISLKTLGGPIMIAKMTGTAAESGVSSLIIFTAFLSLNLSIINLLPIPILDGGHLFFLLVELIIRRPLEIKKMEIAQKIGFALLILLLLTVTYNDIIRSVPQKYLDFLPWM